MRREAASPLTRQVERFSELDPAQLHLDQLEVVFAQARVVPPQDRIVIPSGVATASSAWRW
jgi:hypothetical protein